MRAALVLAALMLSLSSWAQIYPSTSDNISEEKAQEMFKDIEAEDKKMGEHSECFQRAHMWALRAEKLHQVAMEKVYLFFTYKFNMRHRVTSRWGRPIVWWFHVAPAVRVNGELWVMDATFTDRAMPLQEWAGSLMQEPEACQPINDPQDYVNDRNSSNGYRNLSNVKNQCYYTTAPRFFYQPVEIGFMEDDERMRYVTPMATPAHWNPSTWFWALSSYDGRKNQKSARQALGF
ncbi:MAG: hypothetical protein K2P81_05340 [Bacteriovoracaceae bacterium]|nr:hypothetical protein [Bacteriovoracaceae bacterium]